MNNTITWLNISVKLSLYTYILYHLTNPINTSLTVNNKMIFVKNVEIKYTLYILCLYAANAWKWQLHVYIDMTFYKYNLPRLVDLLATDIPYYILGISYIAYLVIISYKHAKITISLKYHLQIVLKLKYTFQTLTIHVLNTMFKMFYFDL